MSSPAALEHQIREHAYFLWLSEGATHGRAHEHWIAAERALSTVASIRVAAAAKTRAKKAAAPTRAAAKPKRAAPKKLVAATRALRGAHCRTTSLNS